ncbi:MAG: transcription termination/antitermination protein NusG [bacterium]|jgi:transcriptional antiterminator NusG|nr:transcription termination/antitermination protein NusG [bacterium]
MENEVMVEKNKEKRWYVLHTHSGYEAKAKASLERRIQSMGLEDRISQVVIPTEEEIEIKDGKKKRTKKKIFPGYIMIEMAMDNDIWQLVRNTTGITGFISSGSKPVPLQEREVQTILHQMGMAAPKIKVAWDPGDSIRVISGPFMNFTGVIEDIYPEQGKLRALLTIFGRETPVELEFYQVEKL